MDNLHYVLKSLRIEKGISQKVLSENLNLSRTAYSNYEQGIREPSLDIIKNIADFYNCSVDYLLGREDDFGNIKEKSISTEEVCSANEKYILDTYRKISDRDKGLFLNFVDYFNMPIKKITERVK